MKKLNRIQPIGYSDEMCAKVEAIALFSFPGLGDLRSVLADTHPDNGYPPLMLLATVACARIWGSQNKALREIRKGNLWPKLTAAYSELTDHPGPFPTLPPTAKRLDDFIRKLGGDADQLHALHERFMASSVGLAKHLGQFDSNSEPDWTSINPDHLIMGDGTYVKPFSEVREHIDPDTGRPIYIGSRAKNRARIQTTFTEAAQDKKTAVGINHVTVTTPTRFGWVVLGVDQAFGAEIRTATPLIEKIIKLAGVGVHTVAWDGAYSGVSKEVLVARHGVLVLTKPVSRGERRQQGDAGAHLPSDECITMFCNDEPLPRGTSVFPTSNGYEMVRTYMYEMGPIPEIACAHNLWVDGDALVDVVYNDDGQPVKAALARTVRATRQKLDGGRFGIEIDWALSCPDAGEHTFTTVSGPRNQEADKAPSGYAGAVNAVSPVPRAYTRAFSQGYGFRNWCEAFNAWFKSRLGTGAGVSRAMRLAPEHQAIDHLCAGLVANCITEWRHDSIEEA